MDTLTYPFKWVAAWILRNDLQRMELELHIARHQAKYWQREFDKQQTFRIKEMMI